ncbi:MFS transporter [Picrophilus oshimae]|uniref:Sugar transporter n=1 Tax=Picrophilus torridus (strain ATCC 700027 / DSM 9790 / JCM 10055 / NBRC 100828 / KAW 2/3) TaxID=1122961 RepID=Q6L059_PICTO|nr:MFS transporter [Picrophilus oshimae]AAT43643.1 sugar transporter [Picrophilus oshimae DSM 9789]
MINNDFEKINRFILSNDNRYGIFIIIIVSASIFLDVWDLTSLSFVLTFFKSYFSSAGGFLIGISVASANIGAIAGSFLSPYMTESLGRRRMLLINMVIFIISAIVISISNNIIYVIIFRIIMGFSIGNDVVTGFTYIYEYTSEKQRSSLYPLWAYAFSGVALLAILTVYILYYILPHYYLWRSVFIIAALFALIILTLRYKLLETPLWLYKHGRNDQLEYVLENVYKKHIEIRSWFYYKPNFYDMIRMFKNNEYLMLFTLSLNGIVGFIGWGFSFYVTYMLFELHVYSFESILAIDALIYGFGLLGAISSRFLFKMYGSYRLSVTSSFIAAFCIMLLLLAFSGYINLITVIPLTILIIFFNYLGPMAYNAVLNNNIDPMYRSQANGWNYMFNKIVEAISGLSAGIIIIEIGDVYNTLMLFIIIMIFSVMALISGRYLKSDFQSSESL